MLWIALARKIRNNNGIQVIPFTREKNVGEMYWAAPRIACTNIQQNLTEWEVLRERTYSLGWNGSSRRDISTPQDSITVRSPSPAPELEWKSLAHYRTHNSELVQSFHDLRRKVFSCLGGPGERKLGPDRQAWGQGQILSGLKKLTPF